MIYYRQRNINYEAGFIIENGQLEMYERRYRPKSPNRHQWSNRSKVVRDHAFTMLDNNTLGIPAGDYSYNSRTHELTHIPSPGSRMRQEPRIISAQDLQGYYKNLQRIERRRPGPAPLPVIRPQALGHVGIQPARPRGRPPAGARQVQYNDPATHHAINQTLRQRLVGPRRQFSAPSRGRSTLQITFAGNQQPITITKQNNIIEASNLAPGCEHEVADIMVKTHLAALEHTYGGLQNIPAHAKHINITGNPTPAMNATIRHAAAAHGLTVNRPAQQQQRAPARPGGRPPAGGPPARARAHRQHRPPPGQGGGGPPVPRPPGRRGGGH